MKGRGLVFAVALLVSSSAFASHFRSGQLTYQRTAGNTVQFTLTTAWRSEFASLASTVQNNYPLHFGDNTSAVGIAPVTVGSGTDRSGASFVIFRQVFTHTYASAGPWNVFWANSATSNFCCRLSATSLLINAADAEWRLETIVDLRIASDDGSPVSSVPPILQLAKGGVRQFAIPVSDPDGRGFSCRMASVAESRIPTVAATPGKVLSVTPACVLEWDTSATTVNNKYAVQVMIESDDSPGADATKVPVDFLIEITDPVANAAPSCSGISGEQVLTAGTAFATSFVGTDPDGVTLKVNHLGLPAGAALSPVAGTVAAIPFTATFSMTPTLAQINTSHAVTVVFSDASGAEAYCPFSIKVVSPDTDGDGTPDTTDNCPTVPNPSQADMDGDGIGDDCDGDVDGDGVLNNSDNCFLVPNSNQSDVDGDGAGDACDGDDDGDGIDDDVDNCISVANADQLNNDGDQLGDVCDADDDNDGVADPTDNCAFDANPSQADLDSDGVGDVCDPDDDNDGVNDVGDNCAQVANPNQENNDGDAQGDACDADDDNDGVGDSADNCVFAQNSNQADLDGDGVGDVCDSDDDNDGVADSADNCATVANSDQQNNDGDADGDACDADDDNDGVADGADNCVFAANASQSDADGDGEGDVCDGDDDGDAVPDAVDNCPSVPNASQADNDGDGAGDACDADDDNDGVLDVADNCAKTANPTQADNDADGAGDVCDADDDNDSVADASDNCALIANVDQANTDGDAFGNACDMDDDNDNVADADDSCPLVAANGDADQNGCSDVVAGLCALVESMSLPWGTTNSLCSKASAAAKASSPVTAANILDAFIHQVDAQRGKSIPSAQADILKAYATNSKLNL